MKYQSLIKIVAAVSLLATTQCKTSGSLSDLRYERDEFADDKPVIPPPFGGTVAMDMAKLRQAAFDLCQRPYEIYQPKSVVLLDPPACFGWTAEQMVAVRKERGLPADYQFNCDGDEGLVFWEGNFVKSKGDILPGQNGDDQLNFQAIPRASGEKFPLPVYVDRRNEGVYDFYPWTPGLVDTSEVDGSGRKIIPPFKPQQVQPEGRYWVGINSSLGFLKGAKYDFQAGQYPDYEIPGQNFPRVFVMGGNLYSRFIHTQPTSNLTISRRDDPRQTKVLDPIDMGKSLRFFAHNSTGINDDLTRLLEMPASPRIFRGEQLAGPKQGFPHFKTLFLSRTTSPELQGRFLGLVDSDYFCGAVEIKLRPHRPSESGRQTTIDVDGYWFARKDYAWKVLPNTGFVAISSMYFKTSDHDSDTLIVGYGSGEEETVQLGNPDDGALRVHDIPKLNAAPRKVASWALENRKRSELRADGSINYKSRQSMKIDIDQQASTIDAGVRLYELHTVDEYMDNIVAMSQIRQNVKKSRSVSEALRFKYYVTSYYPGQ